MSDYDSTPDTVDHVLRVQDLLGEVYANLAKRAARHDRSKLLSPEKEIFDVYTPKLKELTYGSDEYRAALAGMKPALDHHYAKNSHHPEHFADGINGMSLLDLIEMLADWKAATERHEDGDLRQSIVLNRDRFSIDSQLLDIIWNTVYELGWVTQ